MAFKDILLTLTSYPEPTPVSVVEDAVSIAAAFGAHLAAVSCEVHVQIPGHFLSGSIANIPGMIAGEAEKSRKSARDLLAAFDAAAAKAGVLHKTYAEECPTFEVPDVLVDYARVRDLTIVPVPEAYDQWYAESVINVVLDTVDANGRPIGQVFETYALSHQIDVLVMGAYGHSKWREFVPGGATKSLLSKPPLPILFSH